jgi:hypothetical protein
MDKIGHVGKAKGTPRGLGGHHPYYGELDKPSERLLRGQKQDSADSSPACTIGSDLNLALLLTKSR